LENERERPKRIFIDRVEEKEIVNDEWSGEYEMSVLVDEPGLFFRKNSKKMKLNGALNAHWIKLTGNAPELFSESKIDEFYLLPQINMNFDIDRSNELSIGYQTSINLPTLSQLAPFPDNRNPNHLTLGNSDLSPEYIQNINIGYSFLDQFNFVYLSANISANWIENWISYKTTINEKLLTTSQPINLDQLFSVKSNFSFSTPIKKFKLKFRTNANYTWSKYEGILNGKFNPVQEQNMRLNTVIENRKKDILDIATGIKANLSIRNYANNESFNQTFFNYSLFIDTDWYINDTWTFTSSLDYAKYSAEFFSEGQESLIWNTRLSKSFTQNKWTIYLQAFDILNQNIGLYRSGGLNNLYEENFNTLSRHVLVGVAYKLGRGKDNTNKLVQ